MIGRTCQHQSRRRGPELVAAREAAGRSLPRYVQEEFAAHLKCGRLEPTLAPLLPTQKGPFEIPIRHIHRVLAEHAGNISATARMLRMHRRTLQRKLAKRPLQS